LIALDKDGNAGAHGEDHAAVFEAQEELELADTIFSQEKFGEIDGKR